MYDNSSKVTVQERRKNWDNRSWVAGSWVGRWRKSRVSSPHPCKLCHFCIVYIPHLMWTHIPPTRQKLPHFIEKEMKTREGSTETREGSVSLTYSTSVRSWVQPSVHQVSRSFFPGPGWAWEEEGSARSRWRYSTGTCRRLEVQTNWRPTRY